MAADAKKRKIINVVWILLGLVFAFSITGCVLGKNGSIYKFYNVGDVYEIPDTIYKKQDQQENGHLELSGEAILDNGGYIYMTGIIESGSRWKYFCLDLDRVQAENIHALFRFMRVENDLIVEQEDRECSFKEGMNSVEIPGNTFNLLYIYVDGEPGASFRVKKMQMRETAPVFTWKSAIRVYAIAYAMYSLILCILLFIWKKMSLKCRLYRWIEVLQEFYISVAERLYESTTKIPWLIKGRRCLRMLLFTLLFMYNACVHMRGTYKTRFKYHLVVYAVMILLIAILSIQPKQKKQNWNNTLTWSWLALWVMECISDFLVPKNYRYPGYVMVFVVGFLFFVWNNMENPYEIVEDFVRAVHVFFGFVVIFCLLFRPETEGMRYAGTSTNPSVFALYLGSIWAVVLGEIEQRLRKQKPIARMLPYVIEGCLVVSLCLKSWAEGPMLYMSIVAFVWFLRVICYTKKMKTQRKAILTVVTFLFLLWPVYMATDWGINHVPQAFGNPVIFEEEQPLAREDWGMVAHAADLKDKFAETRLGQKLMNNTISGILSYRDYYYRQYLRNMNLFGHEKNPKLGSKRILPHNALLGIAYRYGVFAVVPYIMMLGAVLIRTFRYGNKKVKYAGMPFLICLISILMSMTDNVEQPFVWLPWIALYLMMGIVFADEEQEQEKCVAVVDKTQNS